MTLTGHQAVFTRTSDSLSCGNINEYRMISCHSCDQSSLASRAYCCFAWKMLCKVLSWEKVTFSASSAAIEEAANMLAASVPRLIKLSSSSPTQNPLPSMSKQLSPHHFLWLKYQLQDILLHLSFQRPRPKFLRGMVRAKHRFIGYCLAL